MTLDLPHVLLHAWRRPGLLAGLLDGQLDGQGSRALTGRRG